MWMKTANPFVFEILVKLELQASSEQIDLTQIRWTFSVVALSDKPFYLQIKFISRIKQTIAWTPTLYFTWLPYCYFLWSSLTNLLAYFLLTYQPYSSYKYFVHSVCNWYPSTLSLLLKSIQQPSNDFFCLPSFRHILAITVRLSTLVMYKISH